MRLVYSLSCVTTLFLMSTPAFSADKTFEFIEVGGKVLVSTKEGTLPAELGRKRSEGTRIFVGDGALARITSTDGNCDILLPVKKVTVIDSQELCTVQITPTATESEPSSIPPYVVGLGFFTAAAVVGGITLAQDNDTPVSAP